MRYMLGAVPEISEHTAEVGGLPIFWRSAPAPARAEAADKGPAHEEPTHEEPAHEEPTREEPTRPSPQESKSEPPAPGSPGDEPPVLYLHGVPTSSDDWLPFLERGGGLAPDLPGFGRSGKPAHFDYSIAGYAGFIEEFLDLVGVARVRLVVHDWGAVGLAFAQRHPERVARLVVTNAVPFLPGYRWHRVARLWRTPLLGELAMGATSRRVLKRASREANATPGPLPEQWLDAVLAHFDHGTQRAILRLYRSAPSEALASAGERLADLRAPALVAWRTQDPYIPARFAEAYARALPDAELFELRDAGHWWWLERPDAIERVIGFLERS